MGTFGWCLLAVLGLTVAQGRTGNVCNVDMDCPDNAFCRQGSYCVCKDGFVYAAVNSTHKGCLKEGRFGEECVQHIQCHSTLGVHSECANGACACAGTAHLQDERCYESALVGERCVVDQNCFLWASQTGSDLQAGQAYCVRGYCTCQLQYSPRDNGTRCVRDAVLHEECEDELQCAGSGLECRGICRCRDNWVAHNESRTCLESVKALNDPCIYDVQCDALAGTPDARSPGAALCLGGVCSCSYSAHTAGKPERCWHRRRPGQECRRDEECVSEEDEPGYCLSGRCTCKNCSPDARDFYGGASTFSRPPVYAAVILSIAAILRH
ncbi:tenascin-like isoform X2 [Plodia interpunctella]|uniref:tenascin-like isoform X2 n=1 Tax=Plodia interpunctella TaxID=58824 RepID=UPI002367D307|nr:tenascin-like isoform X2 [Plodia interpunctella]XP_053600726.1 tenascin-like isoform X2 [Plodia interpunctella]